ncbi:hypothetical protein SCLCIDRAFT_1206758 [Scleroderma citrinum Foug A]|uniref:Uncharacterized protein n=1 Tax=Scleroderma citrinum Foug A TaxID=1036808 RepID=A0A0C3ER94_9AGAM|nr:hypothetical protein SCLCIDRAFT_1206758 [Scleroderma citrinum Foug A]
MAATIGMEVRPRILSPKSVAVWFSVPWRPYRAGFHLCTFPLQNIYQDTCSTRDMGAIDEC